MVTARQSLTLILRDGYCIVQYDGHWLRRSMAFLESRICSYATRHEPIRFRPTAKHDGYDVQSALNRPSADRRSRLVRRWVFPASRFEIINFVLELSNSRQRSACLHYLPE